MAKKKSLEELRAIEEQSEKELSQAQHELTRVRNKRDYLIKRERRERTHRLITRGAAFESLFKGIDCLSETEFLSLVECMTEVPVNQSLVDRAIYDHIRLEKHRKMLEEQQEDKK